GDVLTIGATIQNSMHVLHPQEDCFIVYASENECSLVALLKYGQHSFLFTGDIGAKVETGLMSYISDPISVLKVAHHGSRYSSDADFIEKISPAYSIIQVG